MIILTKLNGEKFMLNPDLIEIVTENPDTVITTSTGHSYIVEQSMNEIISDKFRKYCSLRLCYIKAGSTCCVQEELILNITIIIGWVISFGLVLFGIFNGGQIDWFIDPASLAITVGGTIGCLIGSFPLSYLKNLPKYLKLAILPKKFNPQSYIEQIVEFAKIARTKGLISLEDSANKCTDPFLKESLMLIVDANDLDKVRSMLDDAIDFMCERHEKGRLFFEKGVSIFPAFGMLGTLVGLVNMLKGMGEDSSNLSNGMATALITTFYGSLFANVIFAPIAASLKNSHEQELLCMQIIEEGVLSIAAGSNPRLIQEKLEFMLAQTDIKKKGDSK